ncbi:MAG: hypothetical protein M9920_08550 [Verrucomicrobiae bacterium]|nr:hypothetical protein [Verrucomicrobiae bacterium]
MNSWNYEESSDDIEPVRCPVCRKAAEKECRHLVFHGDDLRTDEVIAACDAESVWNELMELDPDGCPEFASEFFEVYGENFPTLAENKNEFWEGGAPGLSGSYCFVWRRGRGNLYRQISEFLEQRLKKLRDPKKRRQVKPQ